MKWMFAFGFVTLLLTACSPGYTNQDVALWCSQNCDQVYTPTGDNCTLVMKTSVYNCDNYIPVLSENETFAPGGSKECCYPTNCVEAVNNPADCTCIYAVMCGVENGSESNVSGNVSISFG